MCCGLIHHPDTRLEKVSSVPQEAFVAGGVSQVEFVCFNANIEIVSRPIKQTEVVRNIQAKTQVICNQVFVIRGNHHVGYDCSV